MKQSGICPKCGKREILYIANVPDRYHTSQNSNTAAMIALTRKGKIGGYAVGELEAYVCAACGFCEHYVKNPADLPVDGDTIQKLGG